MRARYVVCGLMLFGVLGLKGLAQSDCKMVRLEHFECDRGVLAKKLAEAKVIRVDAAHMDLFANERTQALVMKLGKRVAAPDGHADLAFEVVRVDHSGHIDFGPGELPLARLNVYDPAHRLIWVETLDGQLEIPWSADVIELLKRFQAEVAGTKI